MLFLEPVQDYEAKLPAEIQKAIQFLMSEGLRSGDLVKINLGLITPLVIAMGRMTHGSLVVGYMRARTTQKGG